MSTDTATKIEMPLHYAYLVNVKFIGPTNTRGARAKLMFPSGKSVTVSFDHAHSYYRDMPAIQEAISAYFTEHEITAVTVHIQESFISVSATKQQTVLIVTVSTN